MSGPGVTSGGTDGPGTGGGSSSSSGRGLAGWWRRRHNPKHDLAIIYANVVLYSICWMAQVPVMPYLVEKLGAAGNRQYGTMQTIFSVVQFVGGLVSGPLMDRYGGRWMFAVSFAASAFCYSITAVASNVWLLYLSRLPAVLQHAVLAARTIVTRMSGEEDRARALGFVAVSYSVGFMVGPAVGGALAAVGLQFAAAVAAGGSVVSLICVLMLLPADLHDAHAHGHGGAGAADGHAAHAHAAPAAPAAAAAAAAGGGGGAEAHKPAAPSPPGKAAAAAVHAQQRGLRGYLQGALRWSHTALEPFIEVARRPLVADLIVGKALVGLGSAVYTSMFPKLLQGFGLDPAANGAVMSYVGALMLGGQALLVGPVIARAGEPATELACAAGLVASFVALAAANTLGQVLVLLVPYCLAGMLYSAASTSRLTKAVAPRQQGTALAIDMALFSGVRMLSPSLGAAAADALGQRAVPLVGAGLVGAFLLACQLGLLTVPLPARGKGGWWRPGRHGRAAWAVAGGEVRGGAGVVARGLKRD